MRKWILPGFMVFLVDRVTKIFLDGASAPLLPGIVALHGAHNTGMALGLMQGKTMAVLALSLALTAMCVWCLRKMKCTGLAPFSISLMAGGALGNLFDRLFFGYVIDLFEFLFVDFYIFNVADAGVVVGAVLCGISLLLRPQDWSKR